MQNLIEKLQKKLRDYFFHIIEKKEKMFPKICGYFLKDCLFIVISFSSVEIHKFKNFYSLSKNKSFFIEKYKNLQI